MDERVTLLGYTSDPRAAEHAVQFDEDGKIVRAYSGEGWGESEVAERGEVVRGLSGEAVWVYKKPGV